jgi:8-oxo-dGTP pyrophosphatase MutT (NUDIX family)
LDAFLRMSDTTLLPAMAPCPVGENGSLFGPLSSSLEQQLSPLVTGAGQAAVLMAITDTAEPELLLIRRGLQLPTHPGEIALPGGKVEPADTDLLATALRESWEEVALRAEQFRCCGYLTPRTSMTGLAVTAVVGLVPAAVELRADPREVDELIRVPLGFFADGANLRTDRVARHGNFRLAARYQYRHYTIWGITAGFIVELVNRFYGAGLDVAERSRQLFSETSS